MRYILLLFVLYFETINSQPAKSPLATGFSYNNIIKDDKILYIDEWSCPCINVKKDSYFYKNTKNRFFILKEKTERNLNNYKKGLKQMILLNSFLFREEEINGSTHYMYFIYNDEVMKINILKNYTDVIINFKELKFKKGTFEIDLKKVVKEKLFKNKKLPEYIGRRKIELDSFPFEEDQK